MITRIFFLLITLKLSFAAIFAQSIPSKGTKNTFDVATWNIEWLGHPSNGPSDDALQVKYVSQVIAASDIDLFGVQEISDATEFNQVLSELGAGYAGKFLNTSTSGGEQHFGFIYKKDVVEVQSIESFLVADAYYFGTRAPIMMKAIVNMNGKKFSILVINFHAKAFADATSYGRRRDASIRLKTYLDTNFPKERILILGDYNDLLQGSIYTPELNSPYKNFVDDTQNYTALNTGCSNFFSNTCSAIDHIIFSNELKPQYVSANTYEELRTAIPNYLDTTSDHLPVFAIFNAPTSTAKDSEIPAQIAINSIFPNPFSTNVTFEIQLIHTDMISLELFDLLGKKVQTIHQGNLSRGSHNIPIITDSLPSGVYVVKMQTSQTLKTLLIHKIKG